VEIEYLATLGSVVTLEKWKKVIETALEQAIKGDDKARQFLSKYVLGETPTTLAAIAAAEVKVCSSCPRLGDGDVYDALAGQIGSNLVKRFGIMEESYNLADIALEQEANLSRKDDNRLDEDDERE
jgi:hypothetical protein